MNELRDRLDRLECDARVAGALALALLERLVSDNKLSAAEIHRIFERARDLAPEQIFNDSDQNLASMEDVLTDRLRASGAWTG